MKRHIQALLIATLLAFSCASSVFAQSSSPTAPPTTSASDSAPPTTSAASSPTTSASDSAPPTTSGAVSSPTSAPAASTSSAPPGISGAEASTTTSNAAAATLARNNCYIGAGSSGGTGTSPAEITRRDAMLGPHPSCLPPANGAPNGSKPDAPLYVPADGLLIQNGTERMSNGYAWIEWLSMDSSIPLRDYAVPGAVIDKTLYPPGSHPSDFNDQADLFVSQKVKFNGNSTVFAVFLGSEDLTDGTNFETQLLPRLISNVKTKLIDGVGAQNFLFLGTVAQGNSANYVDQLITLRQQLPSSGIQIAYANLANLYSGVNADQAQFGFTQQGPCVVQDSSGNYVSNCTDPDSHIAFVNDFPSDSMNEIIAEYTRETAISCTNYPGKPQPNCPTNQFNRGIAYVDITAQKRGCNPYPDLSQLPLQNFSHVVITHWDVDGTGNLSSPGDSDGTSSLFMSDFEGAWEGKIKLMLGLALPQDSWASLYNNSANFITQTNLWNKLIVGFDFLCDNPDAPEGGPLAQCPPDGFKDFINTVRAGSTIPNLTISVSTSGIAPYPNFNDEVLPVVDFVNLFTVDFWRPGDSNVFRPHSSIRDIEAFVETIGYDKMGQFNLIQSYFGRAYALNHQTCFGLGCTTTGVGFPGNQIEQCGLDGELPYLSIVYEKAVYQATEIYDDFSWTKYMIFGEDTALSYDDSETRQKKQDWAQTSCFGGVGIWGADDAVPAQGQHSGSSDVVMATQPFDRRDDGHWGNWKDTGKCKDYGREIETAKIFDVKGDWDAACRTTPAVDIRGRKIFAQVCTNYGIFGGEIGTFYVPMRNTERKCRPTWDSLTDNGCKGNSQREYYAKLNGVNTGTWEDFCLTTPNTVGGVRFDRPTTCYTGWTGEWGYWRVTDQTCAGTWSSPVDEGCQVSNPGFRRYTAVLTGFTGDAIIACRLHSNSVGGSYFRNPTSCSRAGSSALGTFNVQDTSCGIPVCPNGFVWDYAIGGNPRVQGCRDCSDNPGYKFPGPDHNYLVWEDKSKVASYIDSLGQNQTTSLSYKKRAGCGVPAFHMPLPNIPGLPVIARYLDEGPTAAQIVGRESFRLAFDQAWHDSFFANGTAREVGGWIYRHPDQNNDVYRIVRADPGRSGIPFPQLGNTGGNPAIDLTMPGTWPRDGDIPAGYILVANWHTHPLGPSQGGNPQPSFSDHVNAWLRGVPGIVVSRNGLYGYGPLQRENRMRSGPRDYPNDGGQYGGQNPRRIGGSWRPSRSPNQREP
ncbi:hypothetical protein DFH08DRAFT_937557 [Mycena albidolilacea]|uniref:Chitinase II/V-like catalytic domain-containing protein n=1 Tax=Mycena albidolilacea TaxID=1033008 RepID=A0AAD7ERS1_9AGAR|nr:hypothetical protein DFH08DRAFT_937557 [Mycena albidolilacea]